jgi:hypothetical protein
MKKDKIKWVKDKKYPVVFSKYLTIILKKMCWLADVDFDKVNFKDPNWYSKHTWGVAQEYCFILWLNGYMYKNSEARRELMGLPFKNKKHIERFVDFFNMNWGWKVE